MTALPINPTERDRERFRDLTKVMQFGLEYDRDGEDYQCPRTRSMFRLWWSVERERQLLQNLNMSQGVKLSEMAQKLEKAEESMRSLASFVGAGGYNADKVDADVFEQKIRWGIGQIMERLEKAEEELAKVREQKPVTWGTSGELMDILKKPIYSAPAPVPAVAAKQSQSDSFAVPAGWNIRRDGDVLIIQHPDIGGCVVQKEPDCDRMIPEAILYSLADDLLQSAPQSGKEIRHD